MAEKLAELRKKGGNMTETVLWTNTSPSSSFASQTVTLSQSIDNFDYIKITQKIHTSISGELATLIPVEDFKKCLSAADTHFNMAFSVNYSGQVYCRRIFYDSGTTVNFNNAYYVNNSGSSNSVCIPLKIFGVNV